jgi:hypothetical protein
MSQSHHKALAKSPKELRVAGDYMEVCIGRIILDATVQVDEPNEEDQKLILFETVFSNLWDYRISTYSPDPLLIDSNGFQHSAYHLNWVTASISKSKHLKTGTELPPMADPIEGKARSLGWIAFPRLKKSIVPHRLIFQFHVFDPGHTSGSLNHSETLELVFDLSIFGRLLENSKKTELRDLQ